VPSAAVGYSLGEITGLAWAGCLPWAEAARLVAQCGQVLRGCGSGAMARVETDAETARELAAPDRLHVAVYEGARSHVLAGSSAGIRNLTRRAAAAGVTVDVVGVTHALHSPAMTGCTSPLRGVLAGTRFAPPRRQLISTITGRPVMPGDDLTELLARQLSQPVLLAQAMALAAEGADLIVCAGPAEGLADLAAGYGSVPCVTVPGGPAETDPAVAARMAAALFAAGAISDVNLLGALVAPAAEPEDALATRLVPRMRDGESAEARTTARSG
jgi:enediyne polyketide synthase